MKALLAAMAIILFASPAAWSFDASIGAITSQYKAQKLLKAADIAQLMRLSERWCYAEEAGQCAWSDIYLEVTGQDFRMEISNAWSETIDISFIDRGVFADNNQICESGGDWQPSIHARNRTDGTAIGGRELAAIKAEVGTNSDDPIDCFDYLYQSADATAQTVTLLQRQYVDGVHKSDGDVTVTLHFDPASAAALQLRP